MHRIYTISERHRHGDDVRYVGKTSRDGDVRWFQHLRQGDKGKTHLSHWLRKCKRKKVTLVFEVIEVAADKEELNQSECFHIAQYREQGCRLVNATDGGDGACGYRFTDNQKAAISASAKITQNRPEVKAANSARQKIVQNRPEVRVVRLANQMIAQNRPEAKAANSARQKIVQNRPEVRAARSSRMKEYQNSRAHLVTRMKYGYFGIHPVGSRWRVVYHQKHLGNYPTAVEAARVYNAVAIHKNRIDNLPIDFPDRRQK